MILARKRAATRLAATGIVTGLIAAGAIATAAPAVAQEGGAGTGGATATLDGLAVADEVTVAHDGREYTIGGGLFSLDIEGDAGGALQAYCIDFGVDAISGARYQETPWESSSLHDNPDAGKIHWILQNSYPVQDDLAALAETAGAESLTAEEAAAATQAAIWTFSDGVDATPADEDAQALTDWLLDNVAEIEEPGASLRLSPSEVSGKPGETVGPVTVETSGESAFVTPDESAVEQGVTIVDANGEYIAEDQAVADGTDVYFSVPEDAADGSASLTATATSAVPVGRAFAGIEERTQTMILAGSSDSTVTASASVNWSAEGPSPSVTAQEKCVDGGVEITAENSGDQPFVFELDGSEYTVEPGGSESVVVPVENGQGYEITIENPLEGAEPWVFSGVLDCATDDPVEVNDPQPAGSGGSGDDVDLAETGSSNNTFVIAGIAVALLVAGAAVVFFLRRRTATANAAGSE